MKWKKLFLHPRVIILAVFLVLAIVAINPALDSSGVAIRNVVSNSSANLAGMESPEPTDAPRARERIVAVNNIQIESVEHFYELTDNIPSNTSVSITTDRQTYHLFTRPLIETTVLNETELKTFEETIVEEDLVNGSLQEVERTVNVTRRVPKTISTVIGTESLGLSVYEAPSTNIRQGLDLTGGTRVLLQPEEKVTDDEMDILVESMKQRLNVFGLSDLTVRPANDLSGNQFIVVEIAGANEEEVKSLLAKQGKFEAKIGDDVVFRGGQDITYVCRSADCSGIDPSQGCGTYGDGYSCRFRFSITLEREAAQRQADATRDLPVVTTDEAGNSVHASNQYLSEPLRLILDDVEVDRLNIGASLRGTPATDIQISGSGIGITQDDAINDALANMKELQTVLITGSLPVKLQIVKTDVISPSLGKEFVTNALLIGLYSILAVVVVVFIRFRTIKVSIPMAGAMLAEVVLILGIAALIGWNLDLAAIAGIIIAVGTGVDDQIVITDETMRGKGSSSGHGWKKRLKNAFFIIMAAYATTMVAMLPLLGAGAGLLKGFAITTMMGVTFGVFITRPAYAAVIEQLLKD